MTVADSCVENLERLGASGRTVDAARQAADELSRQAEDLGLYAETAGPLPSPCSPWCDVWRDDSDARKWRGCTHRRRP